MSLALVGAGESGVTARVAVVALEPPGTSATAVASAVRTELQAQQQVVLSDDETRQRMLGPTGAAGTQDMARIRQLMDESEKLFREFNLQQSRDAIVRAVELLEADAELTQEKVDALQLARLRAANVLLAIAGNKETGKGETEVGRQARVHLQNAVRVNPLLNLDAAEYPPRMRRLMDGARAEVSKAGVGALAVTSEPNGAVVFLEGRRLGPTPLKLAEAAPRGSYRLWVERDGLRSLQRRVELGEREVVLEVDLAFESLLTSTGALRVPHTEVGPAVAQKVATLLGATSVVFVTEWKQEGETWAGVVVFDAGSRAVIRRGAARTSDPQAIRVLAGFAGQGQMDPRLTRITPGLPAPPTARPRSVLMLPLEGGDIPPSQVEAVEARLREALGRVPQHTVISRDQTILGTEQATGAGWKCDGNATCLAQLGRQFTADALIAGKVRREGITLRVDLRSIRMDTGSEERRISEAITNRSEDDAKIQALALSYRMLSPERYVGTLIVECPVKGARILVDGVDVGEAPLDRPMTDLLPGTHVVRVTGANVRAGELYIPVEFQGTTKVRADLVEGAFVLKTVDASAPPPAAPVAATAEKKRGGGIPPLKIGGGALAVTSVGVLLVSLAVGLVGGLVGGVGVYQFATAPRSSTGSLTPAEGETGQDLTQRVNMMVGLMASGGVGLGVGAVVLVVAVVLGAAGVGLLLAPVGGE
ncbi:MAG: PEGA domain-containing protein [Myxococcota bacterium]